MSNNYRKKTVEFKAVQNTLKNVERLDSFLDEHGISFDRFDGGLVLFKPTIRDHKIRLPVGMWLIRWAEGDWSVVSPSVFEQHYEEVPEEEPKFVRGDEVVITKPGDLHSAVGTITDGDQGEYTRWVDVGPWAEEFLISDLKLRDDG